ncbi:hypothetical protein M3P05_17535 [Sansalvadorimonas sp. 2012CJ34-2]|uniref:Uncharacterized protein n=1 Tax=Parendozoicomonas callyspongiae TaxID=2942213 RepID=A0ABT0PK41_9GAMM|nr:hypothetical protein [Sansalvadorimonas sp. 2012CJ34-2]MCL6271724.1 hypothetical protein [Sansalvadorimonas sp. 2012CJ34-2]
MRLLGKPFEEWESNDPELQEFEARIDALDSGIATLKVLMDQYQLKLHDLKDELGGKSNVSME